MRIFLSLVATLAAACAVMPQTDPQMANEIANIANKACIDKFGIKPSFALENWRVRESGDVWWAETGDGKYQIYISMADRTPDFLGCLILITAAP